MMAPAWGAEVVSSNIVGYEKVSLVSGFNMVGVQFVDVGTQAAKSLSSATQLDSTMSGFDEDGNYASKIKVCTGRTRPSESGIVLSVPDLDLGGIIAVFVKP